ncbi:MAG: hypothetical protein Kow0090_05490 [Myxococcota bacterium]
MPGEVVFRLKDTYGFPDDLTELIGAEQGFAIDREGFERALEEQRSRSEWKGSGEKAVGQLYVELGMRLGDTVFTGYEKEKDDGKVLAIISGKEVAEVKAPAEVEFITDKTPFYGEIGGQVGDIGKARSTACELEIIDAQRPGGGLIVHKAKLLTGALKVGDRLTLEIDSERRERIRANHTATHLLHYSLQKVLGEHVRQAGSLVEPSRLRFDYNSISAPTAEQLNEIERLANSLVYKNYELETAIMDIEEARKSGAKALFGEKYGAKVRVVSCGPTKELCGGTHVRRSGDIGLIKIISETGVAAGVRRIIAVTRDGAVAYIQERERLLEESAERLKTAPSELLKKIEQKLAQEKELRREIESLNRKLAMGAGGKTPLDYVKEVKGVKFLALVSEVADARTIGEMVDNLKLRLKSGVVVVGTEADGKAIIVVGVTDDLTNRVSAGEVVKRLAAIVGGSGGGRADFARAGGTKPENLDKIPDEAERIVSELLG